MFTTDRGQSYLEIPSGIATTTKESTPGFYYRGCEGIVKLGPNSNENFAYDKGKFNSQGKNLIMYVMDHGFIAVPAELYERTGTKENQISTIHETFFVNDLLPGSYQTTSTGVGHFQGLSLDEIFNAFNILANTLEMARRLDSLRITLEVNLIRLANKKSPVNTEIKQISPKPAPLKDKPAVVINEPRNEEPKNEEVKSEPAEELIVITLDNVKRVWQNVIEALGRVKMSVSTYLSAGEPSHLKGNLLTISFPKSHSLHKESLEKKENKEIIENSLFEALNTRLRVSFILSADAKPKDLQEGGHFIQSILGTFQGRLIKEN